MLIHICCSVDSHYFLQRVKEDFSEELIAFFYDPNIHPYSEYQLRLLDVKRSCKKLGVKLIEGEYNYNHWLNITKGFENEPEKGKRCNICFDDRLEVSAKKAKELNIKRVTTTLLTSPKKSFQQLREVGERICKKYDREFIFLDYRTNGGTQRQFELAKKAKLYKQNYCGCIFALKKQRDIQDKLTDELFSPINRQILPDSIEEKINLYKEVIELEERNIDFNIVKNRFLNYRLLNAKVIVDKKVVPSYILALSKMRKNYTKGEVEFEINNIFYLNRDEVKLIDINKFNNLANKNYKTTKELIFNPLTFDEELKVREKIISSNYDLSAIIILDKIEKSKYEIEINSKVYEDIREKIEKNSNFI